MRADWLGEMPSGFMDEDISLLTISIMWALTALIGCIMEL